MYTVPSTIAAVDSKPPLAVEKVHSRLSRSGSAEWATPVACASPRKSGQAEEAAIGDWGRGLGDA
jgi:hypothetical protein